jgi:hypothetical protein
VVADAHLVPDPEAITDAFDREFARMARNARRQLAKEAPAKRPAPKRATAAASKGRGKAPAQRVAAKGPATRTRQATRAKAK